MGGAGHPGSFVGDPVLEAAGVWTPACETLGEPADGLLHPDVVAALDAAGPQRWERSRPPYRHQVEAWRSGLAGRSFMVTSGTGSGKTECFMVPMLSDLIHRTGGRRLRVSTRSCSIP